VQKTKTKNRIYILGKLGFLSSEVLTQIRSLAVPLRPNADWESKQLLSECYKSHEFFLEFDLKTLTQNHMSIHKPSAVCQHATSQSVKYVG
jgi:hypothetical protein